MLGEKVPRFTVTAAARAAISRVARRAARPEGGGDAEAAAGGATTGMVVFTPTLSHNWVIRRRAKCVGELARRFATCTSLWNACPPRTRP